MKNIKYRLLLLIILLGGQWQNILSQQADLGTFSESFEKTVEYSIWSNYMFSLKTTVTMDVTVSFCGSTISEGQASFYGLNNGLLNIDYNMCSPSKIYSATNVKPSQSHFISVSSTGSGIIKMKITGIAFPKTGYSLDDAIEINSSSTGFSYTNTRNTKEFQNNSSIKPTKDVFYKLTLSNPLDITIKSQSDIQLVHYSILDSKGAPIIRQNVSSYSYLSQKLSAGVYYVVAEGAILDGKITTTINGTPTIGNTMNEALDMGVHNNNFTFTDTQNTSHYTNDYNGNKTNDVFYKFSIKKPMDMKISHCGSALNDTYMYLLANDGSLIAYNDNYTGTGQCSNTSHAYIVWQKLPAGTYYVVSEGKSLNGSITTKIEGISNASYVEDNISLSKSVSYIATISPLEKTLKVGIESGIIKTDNNARVNISLQYFDGLGKLIQSVEKGITPDKKDLVSLKEYDLSGREIESWLAGTLLSNGGYNNPSEVRNMSTTINNDTKPYVKTIYGPSSLNQITKQYGPGADWHNNSKAVTTAYKTNIAGNNTLNCKLYKVSGTNDNPTISNAGNYATGQLYVTELKDENGNLSYEFKDKLGQVVLTRQINAGVNHDTYYVYNDYGNLCFVLPPLVADNGTNQTERDKYAYQYKYDNRNRCIYKKLPGCEPIYYIYDKADRLIFSQDGEQRLKGEWAFTLPDAFGRIVAIGICKTAIPNTVATPYYKYLENVVVKAESPEDASKNPTYAGTHKGYNANVTLTSAVYLSANYYDNYYFLGKNGIPNTTDTQYTTEAGYGTCYGDHQAANKAKNKGLLTGTLTAQMKPDGGIESTYLYSVMYYDNRGRVVQVKSNNHLSGGLEKEYIAYNFTGQPTQRKHVHSATGKTTLTETYAYTYDHARRLTKTTHQLTEGAIVRPQVTLAEKTYDELGRLKTINKANNQAKLKTDYTYNVRSWLKTISSPLFNQTLYYNDYDMTQYNGNISFMTWNLDNSSMGSWYQFSYDQLSRLTKAVYAYGEFYSTSYAYDKHGNITNIMRRGGNIPGPVGDFADNMTLTYTGNQLTKADDAAPAVNDSWSADFKDYTKLSVEYTYNKNGAMAKDLNKGIEQIEYNSLNLPRVMLIKSPAAKAKNYYTYSASGVKLRTEQRYDANLVANPVITTTPTSDGLNDYKITEYVGNIIYETSKVLSSAQTSKTRILIDGGYIENGEYYYYITDHLGNNRAVAASHGAIAQRSDYYPFGMALKISNDQERQPYKYNGKELDQMHGLNTYDYSARYYDPGIARFTSVDPHAEKYFSWSPYVYVGNNPIIRTDPTGMDWYTNKDRTAYFWQEGNAASVTRTIGEGENAIQMEMTNIGESYLQMDGEKAILWGQNTMKGISYFDSKTNGEIKQIPLMGAHATGWSFNMEISVGVSIESALVNIVTFHAGNDVGDTYLYQTVSNGGGLIDGNVALSHTAYYYRGNEGNFDHSSLLGGGLEFTGSLGPFSGGWSVSYPDRYGARTYGQTYGIGIGFSPFNINMRKTQTSGGVKMQ